MLRFVATIGFGMLIGSVLNANKRVVMSNLSSYRDEYTKTMERRNKPFQD